MKKNFVGKEEEKYEIQIASDGGGGGMYSAVFGFRCHGAVSALRAEPHMKGGKTVAALMRQGASSPSYPLAVSPIS